MPDDVFWGSTPVEVNMLMRVYGDRAAQIEEARAKAAQYRTAWIACEIRNQWAKKGQKIWKPEDLLKKKKEPWTPERMIAVMRGLASDVNRRAEA